MSGAANVGTRVNGHNGKRPEEMINIWRGSEVLKGKEETTGSRKCGKLRLLRSDRV